MVLPQLVDTHCHIHTAQTGLDERDHTTKKWHDAGETDPDRMIEEAAKAGVNELICVGTDLADSRTAVDFARKRANCWASVGVHPHEAAKFLDEGGNTKLAELLKNPSGDKIVAVGECGLDYFYEHSPKAAQREVLEQHLQIALDRSLPIIFHIREAYSDFWPILANFRGIRGVLHSFTADTHQLNKALTEGLSLGLNGIMTFTNDPEQITMSKSVPLESLLMETDAPYLTPKPFRGKICKSEYVRLTAEFLARIRGETLEQLANVTTANARTLFKLK